MTSYARTHKQDSLATICDRTLSSYPMCVIVQHWVAWPPQSNLACPLQVLTRGGLLWRRLLASAWPGRPRHPSAGAPAVAVLPVAFPQWLSARPSRPVVRPSALSRTHPFRGTPAASSTSLACALPPHPSPILLALLCVAMPSPASSPLLLAPPSPFRRRLATCLPLCLLCVAVPVLLTAAVHLRPRPTPRGGVKAGASPPAGNHATAATLAAATSPAEVLAAAATLIGRDRCGLWGMTGRCRAALKRYEWRHGGCESFVWGGCGGLVPFETQEACEAAGCEEKEEEVDKEGEGLAAAVQAAWRRVDGQSGGGSMKRGFP